MDISIPINTHTLVATISTVFGSAATAGYLTWRKIVRDKSTVKLESTKTNAEIDVVQHLQQQRDYAMAEAKEAKRSQMVADYETQSSKAKITALETELANLRIRIQLLSQLVSRLTTALDLTRNQLNSILKKTRGSDDSHK